MYRLVKDINPFKVMLHERFATTIFGATVLQHCYDIVSNSYNIIPILRRCVALKIVIANRPVQHHLKSQE